MAIDITALYCCLDDFCKLLADWEAHRLLPSETYPAAPRQAVARRDAVHCGAVSPLAVHSTSRHSTATGSASSIAPALAICRTMTVLSA